MAFFRGGNLAVESWVRGVGSEAGTRVHKQLVVFQGRGTEGQQLASTYLL